MMTASRPDLFPTRRAALRLAAVGLVLGLAACGKRGPLEPPPGSADAAKSQKSQDDQQGIPGLKGAKKRPPPVTPPKRDFFLDFLL